MTVATVVLAGFFIFNTFIASESQTDDSNVALELLVPTEVTLPLSTERTVSTLSITPIAVLSDNRCPAGVQCATPGTIEVRFAMSEEITNGTVLLEPDEPVEFGAYSVALTAVEPAASQNPIPEDEYRFTVTVSPR